MTLFGHKPPLPRLEYAKFIPTPVFHNRVDKGEKLISENKHRFIDAYHDFERQQKAKSDERKLLYQKEIKAWNTKKCAHCGSTVRFVSNWNFWGCSNFRSPGEHSRFNTSGPYIREERVAIDANWITEIIKQQGFKGKVTASALFELFSSEGLEDLRTKYGYAATEKRLQGFVEANKRSKEQELLIKNTLETSWGKVLYQQTIAYKRIGGKELHCRPDFVCGTHTNVYIFDAKLDRPDDEQMSLYIELIQFIIIQKNDKRPVSGIHIFYDDNEYIGSSQYPIFTISEDGVLHLRDRTEYNQQQSRPIF